jgi:uncharacterized membrane protein YdcZ (DUF606 family)
MGGLSGGVISLRNKANASLPAGVQRKLSVSWISVCDGEVITAQVVSAYPRVISAIRMPEVAKPIIERWRA